MRKHLGHVTHQPFMQVRLNKVAQRLDDVSAMDVVVVGRYALLRVAGVQRVREGDHSAAPPRPARSDTHMSASAYSGSILTD
jgi:hypothetical protein